MKIVEAISNAFKSLLFKYATQLSDELWLRYLLGFSDRCCSTMNGFGQVKIDGLIPIRSKYVGDEDFFARRQIARGRSNSCKRIHLMIWLIPWRNSAHSPVNLSRGSQVFSNEIRSGRAAANIITQCQTASLMVTRKHATSAPSSCSHQRPANLNSLLRYSSKLLAAKNILQAEKTRSEMEFYHPSPFWIQIQIE